MMQGSEIVDGNALRHVFGIRGNQFPFTTCPQVDRFGGDKYRVLVEGIDIRVRGKILCYGLRQFACALIVCAIFQDIPLAIVQAHVASYLVDALGVFKIVFVEGQVAIGGLLLIPEVSFPIKLIPG